MVTKRLKITKVESYPPEIQALLRGPVPMGERYETAVKLAFYLLQHHPPRDVKRKLRYWAMAACEQREDSMFLQREVDRVVDFAHDRMLARQAAK